MKYRIAAMIALMAAHAPVAGADDGYYDPGFAAGGRKLVDVSSGPNDLGKILRLQPDGKMLLAGTCDKSETINGFTSFFPKFCATRLRADGSYDTSFGPGGVGYIRFDRFEPAPVDFPHNSTLADMQRLDDGRIVFLGRETGPGVFLAMLNADGSALDPGAGGGAGFINQYSASDGTGESLQVLADGKLLVGGSMTGPNGNADFAVMRFLSDLSIDASFGNGGYQTVSFDLGGPSGDNSDVGRAIALQADGRILIVGQAAVNLPANLVDIAIARLLPNGQLDPDFGPNQDGRTHFTLQGYSAASAVGVDALGRIAFAGFTANVATLSVSCVVNRLLGDGSQDPAFNPSGGVGQPRQFRVPTNTGDFGCLLANIEVRPDGTIFAIGDTYRNSGLTNSYAAVAKLKPDGTFDSTFGINGRSFASYSVAANKTDSGKAVAVGNGGLMIAGASTNAAGNDTQFGIARLILDTLFRNGFDS